MQNKPEQPAARRLARLTLGLLAGLAGTAASAVPVTVPTQIETSANYSAPNATPIRDPLGPVDAGRLASYVEHRNRFDQVRDAMGSGIAEVSGNLQVGAEVGLGARGTSDAYAFTKLSYTNSSAVEQHIMFRLEILPGEVAVHGLRGFGLPQVKDAFNGGVSYTLDVIDGQGNRTNPFNMGLAIYSANREWQVDDALSTDFGQSLIDEVFDDGNDIGLSFRGITLEVSRLVKPGDDIDVELQLTAWANKLVVDWPGTMAARIGDPTNPSVRSAIFVDAAPAAPGPLPEPGSAWLLGLALTGLGLTRAVRRPRVHWHARPAPVPALRPGHSR